MRSSATAMGEAGVARGEIGALIALVEQDRLPEAEYQARVLLGQHPGTGMLWKILGVVLLRQGKGAWQALRKTTELLPQDAEAHGNLGAALQDQGQWAEALPCWRRALDIQPRNFEALIGAADALRALRRPADSVAFYQRALVLQSGAPEAHNNLGNAFMELGRFADAVASYRRAVALQAGDAQVHCNLSNALRQCGSLHEAMVSGRQAVALDATLSVAHNNLGLILAAQGLRGEASASYRQALTLNPDYEDALSNLGHVLREAGDRHGAATAYGRALELNPSRAEHHLNLGNALNDLLRTDTALECYRQALALQPNYVAAHLGLANVLRLKRRAAEAEASCQAALALDPQHVEALSLLGELHADRGRFAEALDLFQRVISIDAGYSFAYCSIAAHRKMLPTDSAWLSGTEALLSKPLPLREEISVRHALGKFCDDVGRFADAFDHYRQANELTRRHEPGYDGQKLRRRVDAVIAGFVRAFTRQAAAHASASELPVFIVGMPRSGTSLAEQILASHPAVLGAGELKFWDGAFRHFEERGGGRAAAAQFIAGTAADYLSRLPARSEAVLRVIDKMPANFLYAGLIHAVFPRARIIHMQRHPIDTCLSIYFQNFLGMGTYANDLTDLAHYYGEYVRITDHWRAVLPPTALLEVPYEGLIAEQETWTRRMLAFAGLPWDPRCLNFHETERVVITASKWQVRQKIHQGSAGRRRHYEPWIRPLEQALERAGVRL